MPDIYEYTDYRSFLKAWFDEAKQQNDYLSYRYLARKTGVDAGYWVRIFQGNKHLAEQYLENVCKVLQLDRKQQRFFEELYLFTKAKADWEIRDRFERLMEMRETSPKILDNSQAQYFRRWYIPAVRLSLLNNGCFTDFAELGRRLTPEVTPEEAQEAVETLQRLGLVAPREPQNLAEKGEISESSGAPDCGYYYEVLDSHLSTGDEWSNLTIREFQRRMMEMAGESLFRHQKDEREIATLTLAIPAEEIATLKEMMQEFRQKVAKWALSLDDSDSVVQFNLSAFPLAFPLKSATEEPHRSGKS